MFFDIGQGAHLTLVHALCPRAACGRRLPLPGVEQRHRERVRLIFKLGRLMPALHHLFDHAINAQAQLFDIPPLKKSGNDARVAREMFFHQIINRDEPRESAGADQLHAIRIHSHFDASPSQTIIAMTHGIDQCFAHGKGRILGDLFALQTFNHRAHRHLFIDHLPRALNDSCQWSRDLFASSITCQAVFAARLRSNKFYKDKSALMNELLRVLTK